MHSIICVMLSVMCVMFTGKEHGELFGIGMCLTSVLMQSAQMSLSGKLMSGKLDSFQLNFYTGPIAFAVLVAMECVMQHEANGLYRFYKHKPGPTIGIMLGGCCLALMYNVVLCAPPPKLSGPTRARKFGDASFLCPSLCPPRCSLRVRASVTRLGRGARCGCWCAQHAVGAHLLVGRHGGARQLPDGAAHLPLGAPPRRAPGVGRHALHRLLQYLCAKVLTLPP